MTRLRPGAYHMLLALLVFAYLAFWISFSWNAYRTFNYSYLDLGSAASTLNIQIYHASQVSGLEYLSFMTHVSPFHLLIIPLFYLFNSPMTLVVLQDVFIAAAGVVAFLTAEYITRSKKIGMALALAFFLNPGVVGLSYFPFHLEAIMMFFYLLSVYFFAKGARYLFLISYSAVLSVFDISAVVGLTLLLGLVAYWFLYVRRKVADSRAWNKDCAKMLPYAFALTAAFLLFYAYADGSLLGSYSSGSYLYVPNIMHIFGQFSQQSAGAGNALDFGWSYMAYALVLLAIILLWFGPFMLAAAVPGIPLISPWLAEVFLVHNANFFYLYTQNFSYATMGSLTATILGIGVLLAWKPGNKTLAGFRAKYRERAVVAAVVAFSVLFGLLWFLSPMLGVAWSLGVQANSNASYYRNVSDLLATIPNNASVMADSQTAVHLYRVYDLELPPDEGYSWFVPLNKTLYSFYWLRSEPEFIVFGKDWGDYGDLTGNSFDVYGYMQANYSLYARAGNVYLYKRMN